MHNEKSPKPRLNPGFPRLPLPKTRVRYRGERMMKEEKRRQGSTKQGLVQEQRAHNQCDPNPRIHAIRRTPYSQYNTRTLTAQQPTTGGNKRVTARTQHSTQHHTSGEHEKQTPTGISTHEKKVHTTTGSTRSNHHNDRTKRRVRTVRGVAITGGDRSQSKHQRAESTQTQQDQHK